VSRSEHGAKEHDKHEEHSMWCHIARRQRTNNARTRRTTKTTSQHAVQQVTISFVGPGKVLLGFAESFSSLLSGTCIMQERCRLLHMGCSSLGDLDIIFSIFMIQDVEVLAV